MPCRINRQKLWAGRIMLESLYHLSSCFITLTYDEEHYPKDGNLNIRHAQLFLKRLRKAIEPEKLRYFIVGEYGEHTKRAHYHAVLFGIGTQHTDKVAKAWGQGFISVAEVTPKRAEYTAKYCVKKMTSALHPALDGRSPEFARMSLRPGIGAYAAKDLSDYYLTLEGCSSLIEKGDVGDRFKVGKKTYPFGRYIRGKLREEVGWNKKISVEQYRKLQWEAYAEICTKEKRSKREQKRQAHANRARFIISLSRGKQGL